GGRRPRGAALLPEPGARMIREGEQAPDVSGTAADGKQVRLADYRGRQPVVIYFYPKDNTTVCTKEACGFRDHTGEIAAAGGVIIGVSQDSATSHRKFIDDHRINFPLLADTDASIGKAFGVGRLGGRLPPRRV